MFPDPFLSRVAVRVGKGSGYARLVGPVGVDQAVRTSRERGLGSGTRGTRPGCEDQ